MARRTRRSYPAAARQAVVGRSIAVKAARGRPTPDRAPRHPRARSPEMMAAVETTVSNAKCREPRQVPRAQCRGSTAAPRAERPAATAVKRAECQEATAETHAEGREATAVTYAEGRARAARPRPTPSRRSREAAGRQMDRLSHHRTAAMDRAVRARPGTAPCFPAPARWASRARATVRRRQQAQDGRRTQDARARAPTAAFRRRLVGARQTARCDGCAARKAPRAVRRRRQAALWRRLRPRDR